MLGARNLCAKLGIESSGERWDERLSGVSWVSWDSIWDLNLPVLAGNPERPFGVIDGLQQVS